MTRNLLAPHRSRTTGGWSRRCRRRGRRSPQRQCPSTIRDAGVFRARPPWPGAGRRGQGWVRHRHGRGDRGRTAGCGVRRIGGAGQLAHLLHGWPGIAAHDLVALATAIERKGKPDGFDFSYPGSPIDTFARHPYDDGVLLGGIGVLRQLPEEVDAVVSLCRLADEDMRDDMPHVEVRLIDRPEHDENPHLDFVLLDTVGVIEQFRREGRTVLVHCVGAYSRTPTVAGLYGARLRKVSVDEALRDVMAALPGAHPNRAFRAALRRIEAQRRAEPRLGRPSVPTTSVSSHLCGTECSNQTLLFDRRRVRRPPPRRCGQGG